MNPDAYRRILEASIAGGLAGALVLWSRKRAQVAGDSQTRKWMVLTLGTAAFAVALIAFTEAFGARSQAYAAMVAIVVSGWAAVMNAVAPLPLPRWLLKAGGAEYALLRNPFTGVRLFGTLLRNTPLRHLGGRVYLSETGRDPEGVLTAIQDAQRVHLWALIFCCPWLVFWVIQGLWMPLVFSLAVHAPLNLYPMLHLRYTARRIDQHQHRVRTRRMHRPAAPDQRQNPCSGGDQAAKWQRS